MIDLKKCGRCGEDHAGLEEKPFTVPPDKRTTHFAMCPKLAEPILIRISTKVKSKGR